MKACYSKQSFGCKIRGCIHNSPNQLMESFSSMAMTNVICDADDDDDMLPKSAAAAAARGRVFVIGAPGRDRVSGTGNFFDTCCIPQTTRHISHITHHTSHITHHTSHITNHTPHITHHTPHATHHTPHITNHTSQITHHTSHITRHKSHITRHTSHVTHHTSHMQCEGISHLWIAALPVAGEAADLRPT